MRDGRAQVELKLWIGERVESIVIPISESLSRELLEPVELSSDAFSLILASPGMFGGKGNAVTIRRKKFSLRRDVARRLSRQIEDELIKLFGVHDVTDGYRKEDRK